MERRQRLYIFLHLLHIYTIWLAGNKICCKPLKIVLYSLQNKVLFKLFMMYV